MADPSFEQNVARLFAETPPMADAAVFAGRVTARLDRNWAVRRGLIGVAGMAGGAITAFQFAQADVVGHAAAASASVDQHANDTAAGIALRLAPVIDALRALPIGGEALWMVAGLTAAAAALLAARAVDRW